MPAPSPKPVQRLHPFAEVRACFNCTDRESAFEFQRMLMIAEINRLDAELARLTRAVQREAVHYERRAATGKGLAYSGDDGAKSISELRETRGRKR